MSGAFLFEVKRIAFIMYCLDFTLNSVISVQMFFVKALRCCDIYNTRFNF